MKTFITLLATAVLATISFPVLAGQVIRTGTSPAGPAGISQVHTNELEEFRSAKAVHPHCVKGKPCGGSCIAMDKVCHK